MMYSNVFNSFVVAVSLLAATAVVHGEEQQLMNGGDIVQSRKALLLRSRERLLSKARQQHYQRQEQRLADDKHPERDLQMMVCGVCTNSTSVLNRTLLENVNKYIHTGDANTTEILNSMLKTIDASYSSKYEFVKILYLFFSCCTCFVLTSLFTNLNIFCFWVFRHVFHLMIFYVNYKKIII